ncbi:MAG: aminotransferase class V-fold PLP-dependent enzyme [Bacteroidota bacterium]
MAEGFRERYGLRTIINLAGPATPIGAAPARPDVIQAAAEALALNVEMDALQRVAGRLIAQASGAESGCVTACAAAGIALCIAAAMTGENPADVEQLPDTTGLKDRIVIQKGHAINVGGVSLTQLVRLTGAQPIEVGGAATAGIHHLETAIDGRTAAVVYIIAQSTQRPGLIPVGVVTEVARRKGIPVIVDAAAELDLKQYIEAGADLVIYSAHKFLGGATAGIVCGRAELVRAVRAQEHGIGRTMKVGKEGIAGVIAAMEAYAHGEYGHLREQVRAKAEELSRTLAGLTGITACAESDEGCYPSERVHVRIDPRVVRLSATELAGKLDEGPLSIKIRQSFDLAGQGHLILDPIFFEPRDGAFVRHRLAEILAEGIRSNVP